MTKILVVAAVLDTARLTLYSPDGTETRIEQGDGRIKRILDLHTDALLKGQTVEVDITPVSEFNIGGNNVYDAFEKKSKGIKFFKVLKDAVKHIFNGKPEEKEEEVLTPQTLGTVPVKPVNTGASTAANISDVTQNQKMEPKAAIDQIMQNAVPASSKDFHDKDVGKTHTIVAQVGDKILPGVEALKDQMAQAAKLGSTQGVQRLIERLTAVIDQRGHSVEDVLRFLEKGDLRVSDDGDIIAYKILAKAPNKPGYFVDCHTRKVLQRVGSYVCVDEALVDRNRRNECSNGLHIARRAYLRSFAGDVCTLTKIAPEDVVTVPHNDPNKVRVCGYHIIFQLPEEAFSKLRANQPMTTIPLASQMLADAIAGKHIRKIEQVKIHAQQGGDVRVTAFNGSENFNFEGLRRSKGKVAPTEGAKALDDLEAVKVNPKAVSKEVVEKKAPPAPAPVPHPGAVAEIAPTPAPVAPKAPEKAKSPAQQKLEIDLQTLMARTRNLDLKPGDRQVAAKEIIERVRKNKKGWESVGLSESDKKHVVGLANGSETGTKEAKASEAAPVALTKKGTVVPTPPQPAKPEPKKEEAPVLTPATKTDMVKLSPRQKDALVLWNRITNTNLPDATRGKAARELVDLKKKSKVSWGSLNITDAQVKELEEIIALTEPKAKAEPKQPQAKAKPEPKGAAKETRKAIKATDLTQEQLKAIEEAKPQPMNRVEVARQLYQRALNDKTQWAPLWEHKRKAKYSWTNLGFTAEEEKKILVNKPDFI